MSENWINYGIDSESISAERLDGEVMLINFDSGTYFTARGPAADLIYLISKRVKHDSWVTILSQYWKLEDSNNLKLTIDAFLKQLLDHNLIFEIETYDLDLCDLPQDNDRNMEPVFALEVFEDMKELLMIDPIHDTSTQGWPKTSKED